MRRAVRNVETALGALDVDPAFAAPMGAVVVAEIVGRVRRATGLSSAWEATARPFLRALAGSWPRTVTTPPRAAAAASASDPAVTAARRGHRPAGPTPLRRRPTFSEGVAFSVLSFGSIAVLSLVTAVVTARIYGIQVMGEFALAFAPTGIVWVLSSVREQPALVRALAPARTARSARDRAVRRGLRVLVRAHADGLGAGGGRRGPGVRRAARPARARRSRAREPRGIRAGHEPLLEHRHGLRRLPGRAPAVLGPPAPGRRVPRPRDPREHRARDRLGPDPRHDRVVGDRARATGS